MSRILRLNMTDNSFDWEAELAAYAGLGGRGLSSRIIRHEVPPTCHPLSAANKLILAPGLLTGTAAANSGRISVGGKSPLTGTIKESNAGGLVSRKLARLGIRAIIVEGQPAARNFSVVRLSQEGVEFLPAAEYVGRGNYDTMAQLRANFGEHVGMMSIGPAGEKRLAAASIQFGDQQGRPSRAAGRGGLGALMGSKGLKALVVDERGTPPQLPMADPEKFKAAARQWAHLLVNHPVSGQALPTYGTAVLINIVNDAGALPTQNFRRGQFEGAVDLSGEKMVELIKQRGGKTKEGCHPGCVIQCSQTYHDASGKYLTSGFEYESIWALGAHTTIRELDYIAQLDRLCDDLGLDTIETGVALGVMMEGGLIAWGDGPAAIDMVKKVARDDPWGLILGNGSAYVGQALGVSRVPVVKGQGLPAYDPRAEKGIGLTYATSPMGGDHTAGYTVATNILGCGGKTDPLQKAGQIELSRNLQVATAAIDCTGICLFTAFAVLDNPDALPCIVDMINARYGLGLRADDIVALGQQVLQDERQFNRDAGFTPAHDRLPEFFKEKLAPHNVTWDFTDAEIDQVFKGI
ncbi:MAG: aldehyde ferredoxin oxidoreductase C-terminal domain-containing protein [Desulfobacca sp.]|nr:aldehyde ferredoxin oxidoreductase C-terminal domain-containing protein [Desulfobacca sp.]